MSIIKEYLDHQKKYEKQYGKESTIVLMQVGSFHEAYSTDKQGFDLHKLSELLNIVVTKKNKSIEKVDLKNPYMLGFPSVALEKFLNILIENNFTVVIIDQVTPPPKPKREVTGIYSPGTYINNLSSDSDSNFILSIYISEEKSYKSNKKILCIGLSAIDLSTGQSHIYESHSKIDDKYFALDETIRFINCYRPKEVLLSFKEFDKDNKEVITGFKYNDLLSYLDIAGRIIHLIDFEKHKEIEKISYQNKFFGKIFKNQSGMLSSIENINMERMDYSRISYVLLLNYVFDHNSKFINNIKTPIFFNQEKYLHLGNNALYQLDVFSNDKSIDSAVQWKSLFDVINMTSTSLGKRYLKNIISIPLIDKYLIQERYECIEQMINQDNYLYFEEELKGISDIERLHRRISLQLIHPYEFYNLIQSYGNILNIYKFIENNSNFEKLNNNQFDNLNQFIKKLDEIFNYDELMKYNLNDITSSFFIKGYCLEIDEIQKKIDTSQSFIYDLAKQLEQYIEEKNFFSNSPKSLIKVEYKDKDGHYLVLTKRRRDLLNKGLKKQKINQIDVNGTVIKISDLEFKDFPKSSNVKIYLKDVEKHSDKLILYQEKIKALVKDEYIKLMDKIYLENNILFDKLVEFISYVDFIKSGSKVAKKYNYMKPEIDLNSEKSYFESKGIRHPIVERINSESEYIANDISLGCEFNGNDTTGILLYGLNSAGKSTLMKSIGLNIILAQIGYFVASNFFKFSPYTSLFTRISGNDNIFKGMSSYMVEMIELRAILKRNNQHSLIICDEICRGTEVKSANIIVVAMIESLAKSESSFITASHLHELVNYDRIKLLDNVKSYHLHVDYDEDRNLLIFDRMLRQGSGKSYYGLDVAQYIMDDPDFITLTRDIEKDIEKDNKPLLQENKSKYNKDLYLDECLICSKREDLEMHHIEWQKDCDNNGFIISKPHVNKNHSSNLMPVCSSCHDDIDRGAILVKGYEQTSNGPILNWEYVKKENIKSKKKYDNQEVNIVLNLKEINRMTQKKAKNILMKKYGIKISTNTISKIWNANYVI